MFSDIFIQERRCPLRVDDMDQAHVAGGCTQTDEESHDDKLFIILDEGGTKSEEAPEYFGSRKVVLRP
jgi:hypothetical protein